MTENKANNTKSPKNESTKVNSVSPVPADWIAAAVSCSPSTVYKVRNGKRRTIAKVGQAIQLAEVILEEKRDEMIAAFKQTVSC